MSLILDASQRVKRRTDASAVQPDGREALCSTGYSPMLSFDVVDLQDTITRLISMGAHLDGPIRYPTFGKVAALRAPDGHMISLYEPDDQRV